MQGLVITNQGQALMAKLIAGTSTATFTKIATSDHDYSGDILENVSQLENIRQEAFVSKVTRTDETVVEVLAAINNTDLTTGYYIRGLGLYARDGDSNEILYGISTESQNPDYMPPFGEKTVSGVSYRLNTIVNNSAQVTLEINPAAVPTIAQVEAIQGSLDTHANQIVRDEPGVHGFRYYNNTFQFWDAESETWIDVDTEDVYTKEQTDQLVLGAVSTHNTAGNAHSDMRTSITNITNTVNNLIVRGMIMLWSGTVATVPSGWALCNGTNGTPDLRNRFVVGAGSTYTPGNSGGADSVSLTADQMPSHNHAITGVSLSTIADHTHNFGKSSGGSAGSGSAALGSNASSTSGGTTGNGGSHTHTLSGNVSANGSGTAHENRPPYYALAYVMKL